LGGRDIGMIGLGVMGQNLALNFHNHGYSVGVYNRSQEKTSAFAARHAEIAAAYTLPDFVGLLSQPRHIFLMLTAGQAIDATITSLKSLLSQGDVLMDGGNSYFQDTERRCIELEKQGIHFLGVGVSGGEEGALKGPCVMVGGPKAGYENVSEMLGRISAQAEGACCEYLGPRGAGHYVKMIHNGIEYAIIQTIAEAYDILTRGGHFSIRQVQKVFDDWNNGELNSFLMDIAAQVLKKADHETKRPLVSLILDRAKQKGTGKWTSQNALDLGIPTPSIDAAVTARNLSALKDERVAAAHALNTGKKPAANQIPGNLPERLEGAVRASIIVSYAQGFHLMHAGSEAYAYGIPFGEVARIWKGGCIIRSRLLDPIRMVFQAKRDIVNLLVDPWFATTLTKLDKKWRDTVRTAKTSGIPSPAIDASLDYYDGYRSETLPANLIQALRDFFGAHGYERTDRPGDFHSDWLS
jgi:6-phosphogluconate dehydrogenase